MPSDRPSVCEPRLTIRTLPTLRLAALCGCSRRVTRHHRHSAGWEFGLASMPFDQSGAVALLAVQKGAPEWRPVVCAASSAVISCRPAVHRLSASRLREPVEVHAEVSRAVRSGRRARVSSRASRCLCNGRPRYGFRYEVVFRGVWSESLVPLGAPRAHRRIVLCSDAACPADRARRLVLDARASAWACCTVSRPAAPGVLRRSRASAESHCVIFGCLASVAVALRRHLSRRFLMRNTCVLATAAHVGMRGVNLCTSSHCLRRSAMTSLSSSPRCRVTWAARRFPHVCDCECA